MALSNLWRCGVTLLESYMIRRLSLTEKVAKPSHKLLKKAWESMAICLACFSIKCAWSQGAGRHDLKRKRHFVFHLMIIRVPWAPPKMPENLRNEISCSFGLFSVSASLSAIFRLYVRDNLDAKDTIYFIHSTLSTAH